MKVQLVCRSDKDPETITQLEEPFELTYDDYNVSRLILVPDLESYDYVRGQLFLDNIVMEVVCIPPPAVYAPPVGKVPYAFVQDKYSAHCDATYPDTHLGNLTYYFVPKTEKQVIYD